MDINEIKIGDRLHILNGHGYTWNDNGIEKFRRVSGEKLAVTITHIEKLTIYAKTDNNMNIIILWNSAYMYKPAD